MVATAISMSFSCSSIATRSKTSPFPFLSHRSSSKAFVSLLSNSSCHHCSSEPGLSSRSNGFSLKLDKSSFRSSSCSNVSNGPIEASIMPDVMKPVRLKDLSKVLFRNRVIFIGEQINTRVAKRVISELVTLASIDENSDIQIYLNCQGGSPSSVLAVYDCMSWIKPKVGTVCFGVTASHSALILAGGEKGMRYAMPNSRIMIHQPFVGIEGDVEDMRNMLNNALESRHKVDKMYAAFTGQPLERVQKYTDRDCYLSATEAMEFGLIDGILETEY